MVPTAQDQARSILCGEVAGELAVLLFVVLSYTILVTNHLNLSNLMDIINLGAVGKLTWQCLFEYHRRWYLSACLLISAAYC